MACPGLTHELAFKLFFMKISEYLPAEVICPVQERLAEDVWGLIQRCKISIENSDKEEWERRASTGYGQAEIGRLEWKSLRMKASPNGQLTDTEKIYDADWGANNRRLWLPLDESLERTPQ